jgi:ribonucleoside-diphosphate reductase alpha chain
MNAGTPLGQLSACFVLSVEDSLESIFQSLHDMALIQRSGGGTGFSFGRLRPTGDVITSTGGRSSGPLSFLRIFDCATENIKLGGKRRGANMGVLPVDHPDILAFIDAKRAGGALENFNLSVGISDAFMHALREHGAYALRHPISQAVVAQVKADDVFARLVESAWTTGDPGVLFLDTINRTHSLFASEGIEATNPCGEVPLLPYESCNLGSLNLVHFLKEELKGVTVDWARLGEAVHQAVRLLDDMLVVNHYPLPEVEAMALANRKVGLGVMGFAEMLIWLGISYREERAVTLARQLMGFIQQEAHRTSKELAVERGSFPNWQQSTYGSQGMPMRNACVTSIAPTGTLSILAGTSSSIEPLFALSYRRIGVLGGQTLTEYNPLFFKSLERLGVLTNEVLAYVATHGTLTGITHIPDTIRDLFVTALDIEPRQHLLIQAAFQSMVDNAVSKTINLPMEASSDLIAEIYLEAYRLGLKGVTIYRYGSKTQQVLQLGAGEEPYEKEHTSKCDPYQCKL